MIRRISAILLCFAIAFSFIACNDNADCNDNVEFKKTQNKTIVSDDGTEYTFVGNECDVWCFGEREFIGHVAGEKNFLDNLTMTTKAGMYSVNGSKDTLVKYSPDNEFYSVYVKSDLLKTEISLDNCIRFEFVKDLLSSSNNYSPSQKVITECEHFLTEIRSGKTAKDAELYELIKQPDGMFKNLYVYGYLFGVVQEDINLVIPLEIMSFDDKAYSIELDGIEYVLPEEWINELTVE